MLATQFTAHGIGPGVEQVKREAREKFFGWFSNLIIAILCHLRRYYFGMLTFFNALLSERQTAKMEGAVMPPTPAHSASAGIDSSTMPPPPPAKPPPTQPLYGVTVWTIYLAVYRKYMASFVFFSEWAKGVEATDSVRSLAYHTGDDARGKEPNDSARF